MLANIIMQAASRTPGDGTECNYYSNTEHRHKSLGPDVNGNNIGYAELGDGKVTGQSCFCTNCTKAIV